MRPIQEFVETELRTSIQQLTGDALPDASSGPSSPFSSSPPSSKSTQRSPTYSSRYVERDHHVPSTGAATKSAMEQGRAACAVASGSGARVGLIVDERGEGSVRQIRLPPQDQHALTGKDNTGDVDGSRARGGAEAVYGKGPMISSMSTSPVSSYVSAGKMVV